MAKPPELPKYELTPQATPVDTYLQPIERSVAKPTAPPGMPQVKGIDQVGQNSVGSYQGYNQAQQLAQSLTKFNPAMTNALKAGGLALATHIMDKNHQQAVAAAQQAEALLDSQTELSAEERAAATRRLAGRDPKAGGIMHVLNPYREWGWLRGMAYSAGQKLKLEVPALAGELTGADYLSPDQGMGRMIQLRNQKLQEISEQYGVDENTPSYQNYVLRPFNSASDKLRTQVMSDRVKWMDTQQPSIIANNVGQLLQSVYGQDVPTIEIETSDGNVLQMTLDASRGEDGLPTLTNNEVQFQRAVIDQASKILQTQGAQAGLPGQRSKWTKEAYKDLIARPGFRNGRIRQILDNLPSNQPAMGPDGKQLQVDGVPQYLTLGQAFAGDAAEIDYRLNREAFQDRTRELTLLSQGAATAVFDATRGMTQGQPRLDAALGALDKWAVAAGLKDQDGNFASEDARIKFNEIRNKVAAQLTSQDVLQTQGVDPQAGLNWASGFRQRVVSGDRRGEAVELRSALAVAKTMGDAGDAWFDRMSDEIADAYKAENAVSSVKGLKGMLDLRVDANTAREYPGYNANDPDLLESRARQTLKYQEIGGNAVLQARAEQGPNDPPLTAAREQQIALKAIEEWAKANPEDWAYLFPGSELPGAPPSPEAGVPPAPAPGAARPVSEQVDTPSPAAPAAAQQNTAESPVYTTGQLDDMPNRLPRIRRYQQEAVLDPNSLVELIVNQIENPGDLSLPPQLQRVLRDLSITDPFVFIDAQLKRYPNIRPQWTREDYEKLRLKWSQAAGYRENAIATATLRRNGMTALASISSWASMA